MDKEERLAPIMNRYNQVPNLTGNTILESKETQENKSTREPRVSPFPKGDHMVARNKQGNNNKNDPQKKHRIGTLGG